MYASTKTESFSARICVGVDVAQNGLKNCITRNEIDTSVSI